jgi:hypothetical protein
MNWAAKYIGLDYFEVHMCWGMVQICCRERLDLEMPHAHDESSIRAAARRGGWRLMPIGPHVDDIVVMIAPDGSRHVGYAVHDGSGVSILHARGTPLRGGAVACDTLTELAALGYRQFEFWRHA